MGVAAPRAPVGGWGWGPLKSLVMALSVPVSCYLDNEFHEKCRLTPQSIPDFNLRPNISPWKSDSVKLGK